MTDAGFHDSSSLGWILELYRSMGKELQQLEKKVSHDFSYPALG